MFLPVILRNSLRYLGACVYDVLIYAALWMGWTSLLVLFRQGAPIPSGTLWFQLSLMLIAYAYYFLSMLSHGQTIGMKAWKLRMHFPTRNKAWLDLHRRIFLLLPCLLKSLYRRGELQMELRSIGLPYIVF